MQSEQASFALRLLEGMSEAVIYSDAAGEIRYWNKGATRIFGFTAENAIGQTLDIIIPQGLRDRHWQGYRTTMRTGQSHYGEGDLLSVPAIRSDHTRISVAFTIIPFTDAAGQMEGIAAVMRDVTASFEEVRALRKELAALRSGGPR